MRNYPVLTILLLAVVVIHHGVHCDTQKKPQNPQPECKTSDDCAKFKTTCDHHSAPVKCCRVKSKEIKCVCCKGASSRDGCTKTGTVCKLAQGYQGRMGNDTIAIDDVVTLDNPLVKIG